MSSPERGPDQENGSRRPATDEYPLLFKPGPPVSRPGLLARILAFFRQEPSDAPEPPEEELPEREEPLQGAGPPEKEEPRRLIADPPAVAETADATETETTKTAQAVAAVADDDAEGAARPEVDDDDEVQDAAGGVEPPPAVYRATLQMLPGRLVPVHGHAVRQEIRFLRPADPEQEVTLGWAADEPPKHITIDHPSLEMRHASMRYRRGHWWMTSVSAEHPVELNGRPIDPHGGPRHLKDGDRVRLGELDFHFRMP